VEDKTRENYLKEKVYYKTNFSNTRFGQKDKNRDEYIYNKRFVINGNTQIVDRD